MLTKERLSQFSTKELKRRLNFHRFALALVWFAGGIAVGAALSKWQSGDPEVYQTFFVAILALFTSIPVYIQRNRIASAKAQRH